MHFFLKKKESNLHVHSPINTYACSCIKLHLGTFCMLWFLVIVFHIIVDLSVAIIPCFVALQSFSFSLKGSSPPTNDNNYFKMKSEWQL
jgi:hypothetical protein